MKRRRQLLIALGTAAVVVFLIVRFVATPFVVVGESMEPSLRSWDLCLMLRTYHYEPRRGDVITFRTADDPPLYFIKRVVGLPGEAVTITDGVVQVGGRPLAEPYTDINPTWQMEPVTVDTNQVFVIGDNRTVPIEVAFVRAVATRLVRARLVWHWRWRNGGDS